MAVAASGNVFVTGSSTGSGGDFDYATIAYSGVGVPLWTNRYNGPGNWEDHATGMAVDDSGNVFVTGSSTGSGGDFDYATIAYSGVGVPLWTNRYNGPSNFDDRAIAIAVDGSGNVFVTGTSGFPFRDYATIAYSGAGVPLWTNLYTGQARALAVDGSGTVIVTGWSGYRCTDLGCGGGGYATIAYSSAGVPLWTNRYAGPAYSENQPSAVAVDGSGNVFVTGSSSTIAYSGAGMPLCTNRYGGSDLAIGSDGAVYLSGAWDDDFVTVKYVWRTEIAIQLLSTIPPKVNLTLSGAPNCSWAIEHAPEPTGPWTNLSVLLIGLNGSAQFQDTNAPSPAGFYRARVFRPKGTPEQEHEYGAGLGRDAGQQYGQALK